MTFCIAMKVKDGLVGIADTRVTTGHERSTARKVEVIQNGRHAMFLMTSGLRSARDKALTYYHEVIEDSTIQHDRLYKAVNAFADQLRRVYAEDHDALKEAGLPFNLYSIIGGQLENDNEHKLYLLYPQANWVEVSPGTPYYLIGESAYGKPLLERSLRYESSIETALKIGVMSFFSTRTATTDVDFPIDVVVYKKDSFFIGRHRFEREELSHVNEWWEERLRGSIDRLPSDWLDNTLPGMLQDDREE